MKSRSKDMLESLRATATTDVRFFLPEEIMNKWQPDIHAADKSDESTINIYDVIGEDMFTGQGMTGKVVSAILRRNEGKAVTVNINSPGGNFFEGLAIYNLLKEHNEKVTVNVVGMAASAASVIAMAGDEIKVAEAGFLMIHNAWNIAVGNRHEMRAMADTLETFDESMIALYAKHTGIDSAEIEAMMDAETWISGAKAVDLGFATSLLDSDAIEKDDSAQAKFNSSLKEIDLVLAKAGKTRTERRALLKDLTSTPGATVEEPITPRADHTNLIDAAVALTKTLKKEH